MPRSPRLSSPHPGRSRSRSAPPLNEAKWNPFLGDERCRARTNGGRRPHTIEFARFATRTSDEQAFFEKRDAAMRVVQAAYTGLLGVTLVRLASTPERTEWMELALWDSEEQAEAAASHCPQIPEFAAFTALIAEELGVEHGAILEVR